MNDSSDFSHRSTDKIVEEYQKKIKKLQFLSNSDFSNLNNNADVPTINSSKDLNSYFSNVKSDFQHSFNLLESQFVAQFSEYKDLKKVEEVKKELDLASNIKLTLDSYHKILEQCKLKNTEIDLQIKNKQQYYDNLDLVNKKKHDKRLSDFETELSNINKKNDIHLLQKQIEFEKNLMQVYESFQLNFHYELIPLNNKKQLLIDDFNAQKLLLKETLSKHKSDYDSKLIVFSNQFHEQLQCIEYEQSQLFLNYDLEIKKLSDIYAIEKQSIMEESVELSRILDMKRDNWEKDKVSFSESNDSLFFSLNKQKESILNDLFSQSKLIDEEKQTFDSFKRSELEKIKQSKDDFLNFQSENLKAYDDQVSFLNSKLEDLSLSFSVKAIDFEQLDQIYFEKLNLYNFLSSDAKKSFEAEHSSLNESLQVEYENKRKSMNEKLDIVEKDSLFKLDQKKFEFEKQLESRRKVFDDELVNRRKIIIDECKQELQREFDVALDYEKEKLNNQISSYILKITKYEEDLSSYDNKIKDLEEMYKSQINQLTHEKDILFSEVKDVELLTRQNTIEQFEKKYQKLIHSYKSNSVKDLQNSRQHNIQLENKLKQRELELRDSQLKIKRLESRLNQYSMSNSSTFNKDDLDSNIKILRRVSSKNRP